MRPPEFWTRGGPAAALLAPLGALHARLGALRRRLARPWRAPVPVICVGNLTAGGTGKTPTVIALADRLSAGGLAVACLSRGYRGRLSGPVRVDPVIHDAAAVGDEPLLLAEAAPTWVARDRRRGAEAAILDGADVILMDDGFQNPSLAKSASLLVVDGGAGFGNGRVIPAGPLREPVAEGLARADAVVLVGEDRFGLAPGLSRMRPVLAARLAPEDSAYRLAGQRVLAFAGIGRPAKFFETLREIGAKLVAAHAFPDHHAYDPDTLMQLAEDAAAESAVLVTTAKDHVRLPPEARALATPVRVRLAFADPEAVDRVLASALLRQAPAAP